MDRKALTVNRPALDTPVRLMALVEKGGNAGGTQLESLHPKSWPTETIALLSLISGTKEREAVTCSGAVSLDREDRSSCARTIQPSFLP